MNSPAVSVIVVSRGRPQALMRCLNGLGQLDYPNYEIVVVACPQGIAATDARQDAALIRRIGFDQANISAARNAGIAAAAGDIVAFVDDDAVPEPLWLQHLTAPFAAPDVAAAGGYVIGRNGISFQWQARGVDDTGQAFDLDMTGQDPVVFAPEAGKAIKTEGTNMAVRRDLLAQMGGFDPGFRFYLDETDLNMRLAQAGLRTAIVPLAQVHHGFEASDRRAADRTPRDLAQIGASQMLFLRKHAPAKQLKPAWKAFRRAQRLRLLRMMQRGPLGADDVWRLLRSLDRGARDGAGRPVSTLAPIAPTDQAFLAYPGRPGAPRLVLSGRIWQARTLREAAARAVRDGQIVSLLLFSPTARFHRVRFSPDGVWEQLGGRFGRSRRDMPLMRYWRFSKRVRAETARVAPVRGEFG
ncbi:glycosyltransferase family 2 protein [Tropicibacter oceani]|uniref:Glycosyltransferase n=1 Tax=Tropicibacter oceani TaxID=3058420 RepID=A0ABY8QJQ3_9RHOB|nr:glycosyltransferase [Tropicibacter oceani]WGW04382.1 glycosyltransferase [Tropicibacter oceani]